MKPIPRASFVADASHPDAFVAAREAAVGGDALGETRSLPPARFTIHDTFDGRLARAGLELTTVELREKAPLRQWRLVGPDGETTAEDHPAAMAPGLAAELPSRALRERLEPVIEERRLLPLATVAVEGEEHAIFDERQKTVARVRRLRATATDPDSGRTVELPTRLDLEGVRGYDDAFERTRDLLASAEGVEAGEGTLREAALRALGRPPRGVSSKVKVPLTPDLTAGEAACRVFLHLLDTLEAQEDGVRRDLDPEFLHDFRVAVRRTRSGLSRIKKVLPEDRVDHFKDEFRWLGQVTGPTRDLDVFLMLLPEYRRALPAKIRPHLDPLEAHLAERRRREQKKMTKTLGGRRYRKLTRDWRNLLEAPPATGDDAPRDAAEPARKVASKRIRRLYKGLVEDGRALDPKGPAEPFHELRKDGKKLRYLMEFFRALFPEDEVAERVAELKKVQDVLGTFNDLSVQRETLTRLGRELDDAPPETLMALGRLAEILRRKQEKTRHKFDERFTDFAAKKSRKRLRETFS